MIEGERKMISEGITLLLSNDKESAGSYVCVAQAEQNRIEKQIEIHWLGKRSDCDLVKSSDCL
jgi:hypothetical protein